MNGKRILLGITGGIAAYKIAFLVRLLKKEGAEVRCIMTPASCDFIPPLTISTLSGEPAYIEFWNQQNGRWTNHVDLGLWPDLFVIAPLTANTLAKLAHGYCDNLLTATYLSARSPVMVAPAMDLDMYSHPTTQLNLQSLREHGVEVLDAASGELASGLSGQGRMQEPEDILGAIRKHFEQAQLMKGKKVLITAGPTYEAIDPVRFIGNHSTGKMGYRIAESFLSRGAQVTLISGPVNLKLEHPNLNLIRVRSAQEMLEAVQHNWPEAHIGVFAAAVADYRPKQQAEQKIKKESEEGITLELVKNPDILAWAGSRKTKEQYLVGFALETTNALEYGKQKLERKNLDLIVINTLEDAGAGFGHDTNKVQLLDRSNNLLSFELKDKLAVANDLVEYIEKQLAEK